MVRLLVCVGSACHLRGAHEIVGIFTSLITEFGLEAEVTLEAGFCLGNCTEAVTCKANDVYLLGVTPENARERFTDAVVPLTGGGDGI